MFPRYYNLVLDMHPFSAEITPAVNSLVVSSLQQATSDKQIREFRRDFIEWVIGRFIFEQFLTEVRNHQHKENYERLYQKLKNQVPRMELTFSQCVRSVLHMHQIPDSVHLYYNGYDAFLLKGRDH